MLKIIKENIINFNNKKFYFKLRGKHIVFFVVFILFISILSFGLIPVLKLSVVLTIGIFLVFLSDAKIGGYFVSATFFGLLLYIFYLLIILFFN